METIRQKIIACLKKAPMSAIELSQKVGIKEKEVYEHMDHIARSLAAKGEILVLHPSVCLKCGFVFKDRKRFTQPGRCPKCRESHIKRPGYEIRIRNES